MVMPTYGLWEGLVKRGSKYLKGHILKSTHLNDIVFVFDHIQLKIAFDNLLQIKHYFSLNLKQVPNSSQRNTKKIDEIQGSKLGSN